MLVSVRHNWAFVGRILSSQEVKTLEGVLKYSVI